MTSNSYPLTPEPAQACQAKKKANRSAFPGSVPLQSHARRKLAVQSEWPCPLTLKSTLTVTVPTHSRPNYAINACDHPLGPSQVLHPALLHLLPWSSCYFVAPRSSPACAPEPRPSHPRRAQRQAGPPSPELPGAGPPPPRARAPWPPKPLEARGVAVTAQKHSRGPGQAGRRRCRRSQRRLTPPPKAAGSPRARTPRQAQPGRSGAPQRARPSRGGGVPAIRNPRSRLPVPADPSLAGRPGEAALHRRRRSPGGNSSHSGTDSSSSPRRPRARATHSRPRSRAPKVPPPARPAPSSPLVPRPFESSPALAIGRGPVARPASPPGLSRPPRLRAARARALLARALPRSGP